MTHFMKLLCRVIITAVCEVLTFVFSTWFTAKSIKCRYHNYPHVIDAETEL
jgi:hypothetical protein